MLSTSVEYVRRAVEELSVHGVLTKETFIYAERNWRIAPSDVKKVQEWIDEAIRAGTLHQGERRRRLVRKEVRVEPSENK